MKRNNIEKCRNLRKKQTEAGKQLWKILRNRQFGGVKFRRQFSIERYILDFYSPEYKIGIEADGGQHYTDDGKRHDELRAKEISKAGVRILRFSDSEILNNVERLSEVILKAVENKQGKPPHLNPLPKWERR